MPMFADIISQVESTRLIARQASLEISKRNMSIVSIALAGAWALGIPSPVDIDLVVMFENDSDNKNCRWEKEAAYFGYKLDLHCYLCRQIENWMLKRKKRIFFVKCARLITRNLRNFPHVKKSIIKVLGHRISFFKLQEVTPQAGQILIPFVDRNDYLTNLQKKQKIILDKKMSACEKVLHQPDGFYLLLENYLNYRMTRTEIRSVLIDFCCDSKEFLKRAIQYYDTNSATRLSSLYKHLYGKYPAQPLMERKFNLI